MRCLVWWGESCVLIGCLDGKVYQWSEQESVLSHVMLVRERIEKMTSLVQQNMRKAQSNQKRWYDRTARERTLKSGDRVLVLLPTSTSKLLA